MKKLNIGLIAHVDSGKTTLSEAILYLTGTIRNLGRVDKGSSFLDDNAIERKRGITIFSKMARFTYKDTAFTLIDTPGHADFSAEAERTLQVLDCAVLIISASDGIKGQTRFLWNMLSAYDIPVFIFVNKMDQGMQTSEAVLSQIREDLSYGAADLGKSSAFYEHAASLSDEALEEYFNTGTLSDKTISSLIAQRQLFPVLYGSALKNEGVIELLDAVSRYSPEPERPEIFGARVYKIARDESGNRLTFMKVTGGSLPNKSTLPDGESSSKINEIRMYSGNRYSLTEKATAGDICVLSGLKHSFAGQTFGSAPEVPPMLSLPVLSYSVILSDDRSPSAVMPCFKTLKEEIPELAVSWDQEASRINVSVMGQVQLEILTTILKDRFDLEVSFGSEAVLYKETIESPAVGVGHFEPLRHYAEVHLLLEPGERGSGITITSALSTDELAKNWQSQILSSLSDAELKGVLTGSLLTDIHITLIAGRSNIAHSDSGDFREASLRALRQGLMMAKSILLEPFYKFILEIPSDMAGRALNDLGLMEATFGSPSIENSRCFISGRAAVSRIKDYPAVINAYSKGEGNISMIPDGYDICTDSEKIISEKGYDPESDTAFPSSSVFCSHGSGYIVPYNEVYSHAHLLVMKTDGSIYEEEPQSKIRKETGIALGTSDIEKIIAGYALANSKDKKQGGKWKHKAMPVVAPVLPRAQRLPAPFSIENADILVVDGYNVIFAWNDLSELAHANIDAARDALLEVLAKYASMVDSEVIAVFDAYRVEGHTHEQVTSGKVRAIFTAEGEIADQYIERFTNENAAKKKIAVVTSDGVEQVITLAQGCRVVSSREFRSHIEMITANFNSRFDIN